MINKSEYSSKILLLGEYSIMYGSNALVVPWKHYNGSLIFDKSLNNSYLKELLDYIKTNKIDFIDSKSLENDIKKGLYFDSNIPQGYGIGSSGALVAAIYSKYSRIYTYYDYKAGSNILKKLKKDLGILESFYHNTSSGIDPLVSYIQKPISIYNNEYSGIQNNHVIDTINDNFFLLNTHMYSQSKNNIKLFKQHYNNINFKKKFHEEFIPLVNNSVESLLLNEKEKLKYNIKSISSFTLTNMSFLIPSNIYKLWQDGIKEDAFYLKLCGSGNGGYILGCFNKN